jgi:hypothetical protein
MATNSDWRCIRYGKGPQGARIVDASLIPPRVRPFARTNLGAMTTEPRHRTESITAATVRGLLNIERARAIPWVVGAGLVCGADPARPDLGFAFWQPSVSPSSLVFMSDMTRILDRTHQGDPKAAAELLLLVYDELRKIAA